MIDPNSNVYDIDTVTSDESGFYKLSFVPQVPGDYTILASFDGSEAYFGSFAETALTVDMAATPSPPPTASPAPMTDTYVLGLGAGAIIAIVAIGLVLILMLRKR